MIHAFAIDPGLVVTWVKTRQHRLARRSFGLGTPRVLLELPKFNKWKSAAWKIAEQHDLSDGERAAITELLEHLSELRCRRASAPTHEELPTWLEKAEREYARKRFGAILASDNPRKHPGVLIEVLAELEDPRWSCATGITTSRTPEAFAAALEPLLINSTTLHFIDPYFGKLDHRKTFTALMRVVANSGNKPDLVKVHCHADRIPPLSLSEFEREVKQMEHHLPSSIEVEFVRWRERSGRDKLHNRYILTNLGGVSFGTGLDSGKPGQTDDIYLLSYDTYRQRWEQYVVDDRSFEIADTPATIRGTRPR